MSDAHTVSAWSALRRYTPARVAIGRAGGSLPTRELLDFRLAHARAKDALHKPLEEVQLAHALSEASNGPVLRLNSAARDFNEYLRRPDSGRALARASEEELKRQHPGADLLIIVSEGLSALAAESHAPAVVRELANRLREDRWKLAPVCLVRRARVALQDHAGEVIQSRLSLILLGERPGLAAPDSLGAYLVFQPRRGKTDADRNCVSNISSIGLNPAQAGARLHWLLAEARRRELSGVKLKDETGLLGAGASLLQALPKP